MSKKKKLVMNATLLRLTLSVSIFIVTGIAVAGFVYSLGVIKSYAVEVSHKKVDAEASNGNIQALEKVQKELDQNIDVLNKVNLLKSNSQYPEFRVVDEVKKIAANNNITIDSFTYADAAATTTAPSTGTAPAAPTTPPPTAGRTITLSVTLKSPVTYINLLQFTYDIEQNLPKMKIKGLSISNGSGAAPADQAVVANSNQVTVEPVTIEMYIN